MLADDAGLPTLVLEEENSKGVTSDDFSRLIDWQIFDPEECRDLIHCTMSNQDLSSSDGYI